VDNAKERRNETAHDLKISHNSFAQQKHTGEKCCSTRITEQPLHPATVPPLLLVNYTSLFPVCITEKK
jgi:hypothetical protein